MFPEVSTGQYPLKKAEEASMSVKDDDQLILHDDRLFPWEGLDRQEPHLPQVNHCGDLGVSLKARVLEA